KHKKSKLQRQSRTRRRSRQQCKRTIKRGGMIRSGHKAVSAVRSKIGTTLYHDIIPLLTQYRNYLLTKEAPKASDGFIVPHGDKYYTLFEGIEIDDGTKESIKKNLNDDLNDPPKTLEKLKTLYDKVTAGLEKKHNKQGQIVQEQNKAFQSPNSSLKGILQITPLRTPQEQASSEQASSESPFAHTPKLLTNPHFQSPSNRNGNSIGDVTLTPPKLRLDEKAPKSVISPGKLYVQGYGVTLFPNDKNTTPFTSPVRQSPPRLLSKSRGPFSPLTPSRRLVLS
ncbi:hypothetical protein EBR96_11320, partial [bacterium]|nr:hypothetical protein [bacterium]